jgi:hypothetical protein
MTRSSAPRAALILVAYLLGVLGIIASHSGGDGGSSSCEIEVAGIAPARDGSGDVWVGVTARTALRTVHGVLRLDDDGSTMTSYSFDDGTDENLVTTLAVAVDAANAGDVYVGGDFDNRILRLNADGTPDPGFAVGGGFDGRVNSIVPANDGSGDIYVGGDFSQYDSTLVSGLVRLDSGGSRDIAFTPVANVASVAIASDAPDPGEIYSGARTAPTPAARWNTNGSLDNDFNPAISQVFAVAPAADASGNVYLGGNAATGVVRVSNLGNIDGSFDGSGFDARVNDILIAGDMTGDIYVAGEFTSYDGVSANGLVRLTLDGTRNASFDIGRGFTDETGSPAPVGSIALANDGTTDIYAGGRFSFYDGVESSGIARLNADGSPDGSFAIELPAGEDFCNGGFASGLE